VDTDQDPRVTLWGNLCYGILSHVAREDQRVYLQLAARLRKHALAMDGGTYHPRKPSLPRHTQPLPAIWLLRPDLHLATPELLAHVRAFVEDQAPIRRQGKRRVRVDSLMVRAMYYSAFARERRHRVPGRSPGTRAVEAVAHTFGWTVATAADAVKKARRGRGRPQVFLSARALAAPPPSSSTQ
jgi:hypothetical protein